MISLSIGKMRGLQQCANTRGGFAILALDHRGNLRAALNPQQPHSVTPAQMIEFKHQVTASLAGQATAVLLDPEVGAAQCIAGGDLPGNCGLITALDATGYSGDASDRQSRILPGWSVAKVRRMGSSAAKLLVYYHPDSPRAAEIEDLVAHTAAACAEHDLAFFLEPLFYSLDPAQKKLPSSEMHRVVVETARRLTIPGVDVLKAEFPLDIRCETDTRHWVEACTELSQASRVPWILLSASVEFETYLEQVEAACRQGASGVAVGRAVWKEAAGLPEEERERFLNGTACQRMARCAALVTALARPWTDFYTPLQVDETWYERYTVAG